MPGDKPKKEGKQEGGAKIRLATPEMFDKSEKKFSDPELYFNRELSWIEFNKKVLDEAMDQSNPPLEQLKFLSIFYNNLDEFFMVRVASLTNNT